MADETQFSAKTPALRLPPGLPLSQAAVGSTAEIVLLLLDQFLASYVRGLNAFISVKPEVLLQENGLNIGGFLPPNVPSGDLRGLCSSSVSWVSSSWSFLGDRFPKSSLLAPLLEQL